MLIAYWVYWEYILVYWFTGSIYWSIYWAYWGVREYPTYAFLSYVALNMPAYDKNTLLSYVGTIAYEMPYVGCTNAVRCCTSPVHTQMQKRHAHHVRRLTN